MKHYHFKIQGYEKIEGNQLHDIVQINLVGFEVTEAIKRAREIYPKKHWRVVEITECYGVHGDQMGKHMDKLLDRLDLKE